MAWQTTPVLLCWLLPTEPMYLIRYILVVVLLYAGWCASLLIRTAVKVGFDMTCHETPWSGYGNPVVPALVEYKGVATRSENSNEIVSMTSYLRKTIVTIAFVNDFVQGERVELYRLVALYCCIMIGWASNFFLRLHFSHLRYIFFCR